MEAASKVKTGRHATEARYRQGARGASPPFVSQWETFRVRDVIKPKRDGGDEMAVAERTKDKP